MGVFDVPWSWRLMQPQYSPTTTFCVTGDYYGQGAVRRRELEEACLLLGIPAERLTLLDDKDLRVSASVYARLRLRQAAQCEKALLFQAKSHFQPRITFTGWT